jgi:protein-disulfide isomerase
MEKRKRTEARREQRERERRRNQMIWIAGVAVAVILIIVGLIVVSNLPAEVSIDEAALAKYADVQSGVSESGYGMLGDPDAPVRVIEYTSFDCPACMTFHEEAMDTFIERVQAGDINLVLVPVYGTGGIRNGEGAARTALCARQQGKFWEMTSTLFDWQARYGNTAFSSSRLAAGVEALGMDAGLFNACFNDGNTTSLLNAGRQALNETGNRGTPTISVNGVVLDDISLAGLNAAIDQAISLIRPASETTPQPEATVEPEFTVEPEATAQPAATAAPATRDPGSEATATTGSG